MKYNILLGWLLILSFVSVSAFSVGVYEGNDYFYYTNKATPIVDINITAGSNELKVREAILTIDDEEFTYGSGTTIMSRFSSRMFTYNLNQDISEIDDARFRLLVYNVGETRLIQPQGDPVDFKFKFDNETPSMLAMSNMIASQNKLVFEFDEPIYEVRVTINGQVFTAKNVVDNYLVDERFVEVFFDDFDFDENQVYNIEVEFTDLAGNVGTDSSEILVSANSLTVQLLTLQNDSSLLYNYDARYKGLFDGKIFTSNNNFLLKVRTNKPAECFFSSMLLSFKELESVNENSKFNFTTSDNLIHSYQVTNLDERIWVACRNKYVHSEVVYLDSYFGRELIDIEVYDGDDLEILLAEPTSLVTNNPFSIFAQTNERAVCFYKFDSQNEVQFDSTDFINFEKLDVSLSGSHLLNYKCVDVLANVATESHNIVIDESQGVRVTSYSPKYTMSASTKVELSLSEVGNVDCKYSSKQVSITKFANLTSLIGTGVVRTFTTPSLNAGKNDFFIYCSKDGQVSQDFITITYDNKGIIISNFTFVNGPYTSPNYIGSTKEIKFEFDVESLIPVEEYVAKFRLDNKSMVKGFLKNKVTIAGDFSNVDKITIYAINRLGVNKSYEKSLKFDASAPMITLSDVSGGKKIVCNDPESGCAEIFYGFAQTSFGCKANALYDGVENSILDVSGKNYLCVDAYNNVNLKASKLEDLSNVNGNSGNETSNGIFDGNETGNPENSSDNPDEGNNSEVIDPFNLTNDDPGDTGSGGTIMIIAAIVLLLVGTGGGGYYAYKKGYLDKELTKLGIHVPNRDKKSDGESSGAKFTSKPIESQTPANSLKKSGYDQHLKKLNKFIDDKMNASSGTFEAFDEPNKGKVKGYNDTLIHGKKKTGDLSQEDFDEFYSSSSKTASPRTAESMEKEAESFEKYYKKKKTVVSPKGKKSK